MKWCADQKLRKELELECKFSVTAYESNAQGIQLATSSCDSENSLQETSLTFFRGDYSHAYIYPVPTLCTYSSLNCPCPTLIHYGFQFKNICKHHKLVIKVEPR